MSTYSCSQSSLSSKNTRQVYEYGQWITMRQCRCNQEMKLMTSWTADNPGRRFWRCPMSGSTADCGHMEWFDPPMCERSKKIIPGLLRKINRKDEEIKSLENKLKAVQKNVQKNKKSSKHIVVVILAIFVIFCIVCAGKISSFKRNNIEVPAIGFQK